MAPPTRKSGKSSRRRLLYFLWWLHRTNYRLSRGRLGGSVLGMPVLLLTTVGRRSGRLRTRALTYLPEDRSFVVIASNGGAPYHPSWWLNLRDHPEAEVEMRGRHLRVRAREAQGAEREQLWARITQVARHYAAYQRRTSRRIPVIVLTPLE